MDMTAAEAIQRAQAEPDRTLRTRWDPELASELEDVASYSRDDPGDLAVYEGGDDDTDEPCWIIRLEYVHPMHCRCPDCEADRGDYLYHERRDEGWV